MNPIRYDLSACLFFSIVLSTFSLADEDDRPTYGLSLSIYKKIEFIEEGVSDLDTQSQENRDFSSLIEFAEKSLEQCKRCNPYELATLYRYSAWLYYQAEKFEQSEQQYLNIILLSPEIPLTFEVDALLSVSKIQFQLEKYKSAIENLNTLQSLNHNTSEVLELLANIEYLIEEYPAALLHISEAIQLAAKQGLKPKEKWLLMQRNIYFSREDFSACLEVQRKLVEHYSKDAHWRDLAIFYGIVGDENNQLAAFDASWLLNGLYRESDILNFAWLLQNADYPYRAAQVLQSGMEKGLIARSADNLSLQARAWYLAKEYGRAIAALEQAQGLEANANVLSFLSDIYMEKDLYQETIETANKALEVGKLKSPGRLLIQKGIAHLNLKEIDLALHSFQRASLYKGVHETATKWMNHAKNEQLRLTQLSLTF